MATRNDPFLRKRACDNCPFRSRPPEHHEGPGDGLFHGLHPERLEDIRDSLETGQTFHCHKSVDYTEDEEGESVAATHGSHACAGALATMAREGNLYANNLLRISARLGMFQEEDLDADNAPVYDSLEEWQEALEERYYQDGGR